MIEMCKYIERQNKFDFHYIDYYTGEKIDSEEDIKVKVTSKQTDKNGSPFDSFEGSIAELSEHEFNSGIYSISLISDKYKLNINYLDDFKLCEGQIRGLEL